MDSNPLPSTSPPPDVVLSEDGRGVVHLTLNRPQVRNAWSPATIAALRAEVEGLARRTDLRVVVITGAGDAFSAGGDLNWMRGVLDRPPAERRAEAEAIGDLLTALDELPHPLVARVNGAAFGGGFGLVCAADVAVATDGARFGLSEVRLGIVPAMISPLVVRRIGIAQARAHCLSGGSLDAGTALGIGLVHRVVPAANLDEAVEEVVAEFLAAAPEAVRAAKRLFRQVDGLDGERARAFTTDTIVDAWQRGEVRDGITAFLEKRPPPWSARGA